MAGPVADKVMRDGKEADHQGQSQDQRERERAGPIELTFCFLSISSIRWRLAAREGTRGLLLVSVFAMAVCAKP